MTAPDRAADLARRRARVLAAVAAAVAPEGHRTTALATAAGCAVGRIAHGLLTGLQRDGLLESRLEHVPPARRQKGHLARSWWLPGTMPPPVVREVTNRPEHRWERRTPSGAPPCGLVADVGGDPWRLRQSDRCRPCAHLADCCVRAERRRRTVDAIDDRDEARREPSWRVAR